MTYFKCTAEIPSSSGVLPGLSLLIAAEISFGAIIVVEQRLATVQDRILTKPSITLDR
jgi:hypothetical protein